MKGGNYLAAGIEHDERGRPDGERRDARADERQAAARNWSRSSTAAISSWSEGDADASVGLISWGSVAGRGAGSACSWRRPRASRSSC